MLGVLLYFCGATNMLESYCISCLCTVGLNVCISRGQGSLYHLDFLNVHEFTYLVASPIFSSVMSNTDL